MTGPGAVMDLGLEATAVLGLTNEQTLLGLEILGCHRDSFLD